MRSAVFFLHPIVLLMATSCGGGSGPGTPDLLDVPGQEVPDPGIDASQEDRPDLGDAPSSGDLVSPDDPSGPQDPGTPEVLEDAREEGILPLRGGCEDPIPVWEGQVLGPDLPGVEELSYEVVPGPVVGPELPCVEEGIPQGEAVFRLVLGKSLLVGIAAEAVGGTNRVAVAFVRDQCGGPIADCFESPPSGNIAEDGAVLSPGTWLAVIQVISEAQAQDPVGNPLEVSFWFEDTEDCTDGVDNDQDGDTDCEDPLCFFDSACTGGFSGEDCLNPFLINEGQPVPPGFVFNAHQTLAGRQDDLRPDAGCYAAEQQGGDVVWRFLLDREMTVEASMGFFDGTFGQVFLVDETCRTVRACIPPVFGNEPFLLATLPPGTWHAVADLGHLRPQDLSFEIFLLFDEP